MLGIPIRKRGGGGEGKINGERAKGKQLVKPLGCFAGEKPGFGDGDIGFWTCHKFCHFL